MNLPPLLISYSTFEEYCDARGVSMQSMGEEQLLLNKGLPPIVDVRSLSTLLGVSRGFIQSLVRKPESHYRKFQIRKKSGGFRLIVAPHVGLKFIQRWFGGHIARAIVHHDCVFGFVPGKSAVDAAKKHIGCNWAISTDIENYFPSIKYVSICDALHNLGYNEEATKLVARLLVFEDGLAQGSPASPPISNLVFSPLDTRIGNHCLENGLIYTRYADDITISGKGEVQEDIIEFIKEALSSLDLKLSESKTKIYKSPNRIKVHGLLIKNDRVRLTKGYRNSIRRKLYALANQLVTDPLQEQMYRGHENYFRFVEPSDRNMI